MKSISIVLLSSILILLSSCKTEVDNTDNNILVDSTFIDSNSIELDTTLLAIEDTTNMVEYVDDSKEAESIIEEKYGVQWDFCDCAVKNDSINKAMADESLTDEQFDIVFARWDVIEKHCKEILTTPNTTPEERSKHERKVRKCLKAAGVK